MDGIYSRQLLALSERFEWNRWLCDLLLVS